MSHYTKIPGVPDTDDVFEGMAHFAGTGPAGKTCGDCVYRGYWRKVFSKFGVEIGQRRTSGCEKYKQLTGRYGPVVKTHWEACKYFEPIEDGR